MSSPALESKPFQSPEVRVVEASAGSGKTYALAKRYVQLILNPSLDLDKIPIRNVLALTFTNKAAFEMKERILEFLKKIALKQLSACEENDILKPIGLNGDQASVKAFDVMEGVIRHYNFFQVQTIDKFINALISGCAFKVGLTANFKIKTNSSEYLQYSLDQLIDQAGQDKAILKSFQTFLHHYLYLENRSGWFPKNDILEIITTLFDQSNTYGQGFKAGAFAPDDVIKKKRTILDEINALRANLPEKTHAGFLKSLDKFLNDAGKGFDIDSISDYFAREDIPVNKGVDVPRALDKQWQKIRKQLRQLCLCEAYSLFNPYINLFSQTMNGFYALSSKDDCLFLNELNKRASALFDDERVTVEELYYRLATRFHHYLLDEFQDTSRLQWHNLETMAQEALSTGGTLFYVGDRKQAIYSFRGGDVALFDDVKQNFAMFNPRVDLLTNNWRSQKHIVEFNNVIFSSDNLTRFIGQKQAHEVEKNKNAMVHFTKADVANVCDVFASAQQTFKADHNAGRVCMEYIDIDKKEERDEVIREKLLSLIQDLKARFAYRDMAILTRGNQEIKEITNWLLEEGVPVESERTSDITENTLIGELVSFLQFLNSPIDNLAFSNFITGSLFARAAGIQPQEMHAFVFSLRERLINEKDLYVYTEFRSQYPRLWSEYIEEFFANVGLYPLYELVITIYSRLKVLDHCPDAQGFFMHFLELIKKAEDDHADLQSFLDFFDILEGEGLYVRVPDSDAVKILTVHKSKGLEFLVVILPFLGVDVQIGSRSGEYQPSYLMRQQKDGIELLRVKKKYRKFSEELDAIYEQEYKKAFLSELNSVYVALTRPKNELYGFIPKKVGNSFNILRFLIPEEQYALGQVQTYEQTKPKDVSVQSIPASQYPDWIDYLKDEFLDVAQLSNREQKQKGEFMHCMLEQMGNLSKDTDKNALDNAFAFAQRRYPHYDEAPSAKKQISALLNKQDVRPVFYCEDDQVFTEKEVVNPYGHTKRCDRLIVRDHEVWVIDYKSTKDVQDRDRQQIQEYKGILKEVYPKHAIKGFLIYLDQSIIEEL